MYQEFLRKHDLQEGENVIIVPFGSRVYRTERLDSDYDYIDVIQPLIKRDKDIWPMDHSLEVDSCGKDISWPLVSGIGTETQRGDLLLYTWWNFNILLAQHEIHTMEAYFHPSGKLREHFNFHLNKPFLRREISKKASNSWVKAKKKILQGDYLLGQKSLFHSLRLFLFGIQIAEHEEIRDFTAGNHIMKDLYELDCKEWEQLNKIYKPIYNQLATNFREVAPKK